MNLNAEDGEIHLGLFLARHNYRSLEEFKNNRIARLDKLKKQKKTACEPDKERINRIVSENIVDGFYDQSEIRSQLQFSLTYQSVYDAAVKEKDIFENKDWVKAENYAKSKVKSDIEETKKEIESQIDCVVENAKIEDQKAIDEVITQYAIYLENEESLIVERKNKAEEDRESLYKEVCKKLDDAASEEELMKVLQLLERIGQYKDCQDRIINCKSKLDSIHEEKLKQQRLRKSKRKKIVAVALVTVAIISIGLVLFYNLVLVRRNNYRKAVEAYDNKEYALATELFGELEDYKDSKSMMDLCLICNEVSNLDDGNVHNLTDLYARIKDYSDKKDISFMLDDERFEFVFTLKGTWVSERYLDMSSYDHKKIRAEYVFDGLHVSVIEEDENKQTESDVYYESGNYYLFYENGLNYTSFETDSVSLGEVFLRVRIEDSSSSSAIQRVFNRE